MVRMQVALTEEQAEAVRRLAAERGVSAAEIVRDSLERYVAAGRPQSRPRPLVAVGPVDSGLHDVAEHHDEYLPEAIAGAWLTTLGTPGRADEADIRRRAIEAAGALRGGPWDLAVRHDDYLAEAFNS